MACSRAFTHLSVIRPGKQNWLTDHAALLARLREPAVKAQLLAEIIDQRRPDAGPADLMGQVFPLGDLPNYEPLPKTASLASPGRAART